MTRSIRLTSKRQATFPVQLCRELGIQSGSELVLERKKIDGVITWTIRPRKQVRADWFGRLKKYAPDHSHDMESIRASIGKNLGKRGG